MDQRRWHARGDRAGPWPSRRQSGVWPPNIDSLSQGIKAYREKAQEIEDYQAYVDAVRDLKLLFEAIRGNILAVENGDGVMDEAGSEFFPVP